MGGHSRKANVHLIRAHVYVLEIALILSSDTFVKVSLLCAQVSIEPKRFHQDYCECILRRGPRIG